MTHKKDEKIKELQQEIERLKREIFMLEEKVRKLDDEILGYFLESTEEILDEKPR